MIIMQADATEEQIVSVVYSIEIQAPLYKKAKLIGLTLLLNIVLDGLDVGKPFDHVADELRPEYPNIGHRAFDPRQQHDTRYGKEREGRKRNQRKLGIKTHEEHRAQN